MHNLHHKAMTLHSFMLEEIVFEGLLGHKLDGFRLCIHANKTIPLHLLETYTFSFQYTSITREAQRQPVGMSPLSTGNNTRLQFEGSCDSSMSVEAAWASLQRFMRELHNFHQTLPDLPSKFLIYYLSDSLRYH